LSPFLSIPSFHLYVNPSILLRSFSFSGPRESSLIRMPLKTACNPHLRFLAKIVCLGICMFLQASTALHPFVRLYEKLTRIYCWVFCTFRRFLFRPWALSFWLSCFNENVNKRPSCRPFLSGPLSVCLFVSLFLAAVGREKPLAPKIRLSPESESGGGEAGVDMCSPGPRQLNQPD